MTVYITFLIAAILVGIIFLYIATRHRWNWPVMITFGLFVPILTVAAIMGGLILFDV